MSDIESAGDVDKSSTDKLLYTKSFLVDSTASYGSINSAHFENIKPRVTPGTSFDSSINIGSKLKKAFFRRVDSLHEPRFDDEHLITWCEKSNWQLFMFSLKHTLKLFLFTLPTILIVCAFGIGYSFISWQNDDCVTGNLTKPCLHYDKESLVYFNTYMKMVLLSTISVMVGSIALDGYRQLFKTLLYVTVPLITIATASIPALLKYSSYIYYYYMDIWICSAMFLFALLFTIVLSVNHLEIQINARRLIQVFLLPSIIAILGLSLLDAVVNKEYQTLIKGTLGQYLIRIIIYPIICDLILALVETNVQKIPTNQINNPSHVVFFYQVALSIIGRYMTTISGSIFDIFIMAVSIALKDVVLHRMSRLRCKLAFYVRSCLTKTCSTCSDTINYESFEEWFFSKDFTYFKAHTLNNDFFVELTGVVVVPFILAIFKDHSLLYYFKDTSFLESPGGALDHVYIIKQEAIQISLVFVVVVMVTFMEARFNRVNLSAVVHKITLSQYMSQILIYIWGVVLFLSSVKTTPNYFQCSTMDDVCSCKMEIPLERLGC